MIRAKILTVDDDPKVSALIRTHLESDGGYEVCEENRSHAALATARKFGPELIILDVGMPGLDGPMVAERLRGDQQCAEIPIIFLSSLVTAREAGWRGRNYYLSKPVQPEKLLHTVRTLILFYSAKRAAQAKHAPAPFSARHE